MSQPGPVTRHPLLIAGWFIGCFVSMWFLNFSDIFILRIIGWLYISTVIAFGGLVSFGALFVRN